MYLIYIYRFMCIQFILPVRNEQYCLQLFNCSNSVSRFKCNADQTGNKTPIRRIASLGIMGT